MKHYKRKLKKKGGSDTFVLSPLPSAFLRTEKDSNALGCQYCRTTREPPKEVSFDALWDTVQSLKRSSKTHTQESKETEEEWTKFKDYLRRAYLHHYPPKRVGGGTLRKDPRESRRIKLDERTGPLALHVQLVQVNSDVVIPWNSLPLREDTLIAIKVTNNTHNNKNNTNTTGDATGERVHVAVSVSDNFGAEVPIYGRVAAELVCGEPTEIARFKACFPKHYTIGLLASTRDSTPALHYLHLTFPAEEYEGVGVGFISTSQPPDALVGQLEAPAVPAEVAKEEQPVVKPVAPVIPVISIPTKEEEKPKPPSAIASLLTDRTRWISTHTLKTARSSNTVPIKLEEEVADLHKAVAEKGKMLEEEIKQEQQTGKELWHALKKTGLPKAIPEFKETARAGLLLAGGADSPLRSPAIISARKSYSNDPVQRRKQMLLDESKDLDKRWKMLQNSKKYEQVLRDLIGLQEALKLAEDENKKLKTMLGTQGENNDGESPPAPPMPPVAVAPQATGPIITSMSFDLDLTKLRHTPMKERVQAPNTFTTRMLNVFLKMRRESLQGGESDDESDYSDDSDTDDDEDEEEDSDD